MFDLYGGPELHPSPPSRQEPPAAYLEPADYVRSDAPEVAEFVAAALGEGALSDEDKAIRLYEAVRDRIRYDPYSISTDPDDYRAGRIAGFASTFCIPKAILLAACLRHVGIPAAVGFADVRNHLNTPRLRSLMKNELFVYHAYVALWLDGRRLKVTPAFDSEMCAKHDVRPLTFDGRTDALLHEFDAGGRRHMEYVRDHGIYADPPLEEILGAFAEAYPALIEWAAQKKKGRTAP